MQYPTPGAWLLTSALVISSCGRPDVGSDAGGHDAGRPDADIVADVSDASDVNAPDVDPGDAARDDAADVADAGRATLSYIVWQNLQQLSPEEGIAPPTDSTNRFATDERAVALGHYMFYEPAISGNGEVSCASCHLPEHAFGGETPLPVEGVTGPENAPGRHTPSLINTAYQDWYFWDGRVDTLWGQAVAPYESAIEMGGNRLQLAHFVYDDAEVRAAYEAIFGPLPARDEITPFPPRGRPIEAPATPDEVAADEAWASMRPEDQAKVNAILVNVMKSIAAFEMKLVSTESAFDRFVDEVRANPDDPTTWSAISPAAQEGARIYVEKAGCLECHKGPLFTDNAFHNLGVPQQPWADGYDEGRHTAISQAKAYPFSSASEYSDDPTGNQARLLAAYPVRPTDLGAFRTPTLRDVALHPPYMHGGQIADLRGVLEFYNEPDEDSPVIGTRSSHIKPLHLTDRELDLLLEFLETLNGEPLPAEYLSAPSGPTPSP